jgi:hypothetical protein
MTDTQLVTRLVHLAEARNHGGAFITVLHAQLAFMAGVSSFQPSRHTKAPTLKFLSELFGCNVTGRHSTAICRVFRLLDEPELRDAPQ